MQSRNNVTPVPSGVLFAVCFFFFLSALFAVVVSTAICKGALWEATGGKHPNRENQVPVLTT